MNELIKQNKDIEFKVIEGVGHEEALTKLADRDVLIDHFVDASYGQGAIEAMTLGLPVIKKAFEEDISESIIGEVPYIPVKDKEELKTAILRLKEDKKYYDDMVDLGKSFVRKYHDEGLIKDIFTNIFEKLVLGKKITQEEILKPEITDEAKDLLNIYGEKSEKN
jgi:glycosyltransferase involved in cell wall biosynthesis